MVITIEHSVEIRTMYYIRKVVVMTAKLHPILTYHIDTSSERSDICQIDPVHAQIIFNIQILGQNMAKRVWYFAWQGLISIPCSHTNFRSDNILSNFAFSNIYFQYTIQLLPPWKPTFTSSCANENSPMISYSIQGYPFLRQCI